MLTDYICPYCGNPSLSMEAVRKHVKKKHPENLEDFNRKFYPDISDKFKKPKA
jgi:hypothetical protein